MPPRSRKRGDDRTGARVKEHRAQQNRERKPCDCVLSFSDHVFTSQEKSDSNSPPEIERAHVN
jgi:hypothetical protein